VFPIPLDGTNYTNFPVPLLLPWHKMGWVVPSRLWGYVAACVMMSPAGVPAFLAHCLNFGGRAFGGRLSVKEKVYRDMFATRANARSSKRNVKQTKVWGHGYRYSDERRGWQDNRAFYREVQNKLGPSWGPQGQHIGVRAFFGEWDPLARDEVRQQWQEALPPLAGHVVTYAGVGHFVEEHRAEDIADAIVEVSGPCKRGKTSR
jgi:pimeloyl-ACP methyl ester carboxylesterase